MYPELLTYGALLQLLQSLPKEELNKPIRVCIETKIENYAEHERQVVYEMINLVAVSHPLHLDPIEAIHATTQRKNPWQ